MDEIAVKRRCADCVCLVEINGLWHCDEALKPCVDVTICPEGELDYDDQN